MSDIFDPNEPTERRKEWVTLSNGKRLCVWEMMAADTLRIIDRSTMQGVAGQISEGDAIVWKVMYSCFNGEDAQAKPIFTEETVLSVYRLKTIDLHSILAVIAKLSGLDSEVKEARANFTEPPKAEAAET